MKEAKWIKGKEQWVDRSGVLWGYMTGLGIKVKHISKWTGIPPWTIKTWMRKGQLSGIIKAIEEMTGVDLWFLEDIGTKVEIWERADESGEGQRGVAEERKGL